MVTAYSERAIHLVQDLKANMLVMTDIMTPEQYVLDINKKTTFIRSCFWLFDLDIKTL